MHYNIQGTWLGDMGCASHASAGARAAIWYCRPSTALRHAILFLQYWAVCAELQQNPVRGGIKTVVKATKECCGQM